MNNSVPAVAAPIPSKAQLLLQLAERCEREWPNYQLDNDIADLIAGHPVHPPFLTFSTSLDAAVTLVPKGWVWLRRSVEAMTAYRPSAPHVWSEHIDGAGETPALALCAAALRARAQAADDEVEGQGRSEA